MATTQNDRDVLLQAAAVRVVPVLIPIDSVDGLPGVIGGINNAISDVSAMASGIAISASDPFFTRTAVGGVTPATITLTATLKGITGTVTWAVIAGSATLTPSGNTVSVNGASVSGYSVTIRASLGTYSATFTVPKYGALSAQDQVNLTNQVTGQLASGNVTGLGALALLNVVNLNTQTVGALNGATQVTNLGTLAYANAIAANQIGAGTLAAGVIYAGTINANQINAGVINGSSVSGALYVDVKTGGNTVAIMDNGATMGVAGFHTFSGSGGFYHGSFGSPGSQIKIENGTLTINGSAGNLAGSLGSRILLKNVTYNITIDGNTNFTMVVNS